MWRWAWSIVITCILSLPIFYCGARSVLSLRTMTDAQENFDVILTKYKTAGEIAAKAMRTLVDAAQEGKTVLELMQLGDEAVEQGTAAVFKDKKMSKGLAFPTTVSINHVVCNYAPLPSDEASKTQLKNGDVVKFQLGAQIDGYPAVLGETVVVGASAQNPVTGRAADVIKAAHTAADVAIRLMRPGMLNHDVGKQIEQSIKDFDVRGVDGMQTNQFSKDNISGKKKLAFGGDGSSRPDACKLEENEVYGVDIVVSTSADGKSKSDDAFTSIFCKTNATYLLKMATSRKVFSEIQKKAGAFPFQVLVDANASAITAQVFFTVAVSGKGAIRLTPAPTWFDAEKVKSEKEVTNEEIKALLATSVRQTKKKTKKTTDGSSAPAAA